MLRRLQDDLTVLKRKRAYHISRAKEADEGIKTIQTEIEAVVDPRNNPGATARPASAPAVDGNALPLGFQNPQLDTNGTGTHDFPSLSANHTPSVSDLIDVISSINDTVTRIQQHGLSPEQTDKINSLLAAVCGCADKALAEKMPIQEASNTLQTFAITLEDIIARNKLAVAVAEHQHQHQQAGQTNESQFASSVTTCATTL